MMQNLLIATVRCEQADAMYMVEQKICDLNSAAVDWWVAAQQGYDVDDPVAGRKTHVRNYDHEPHWLYTPSSDWSQCMKIFEQEQMYLAPCKADASQWTASKFHPDFSTETYEVTHDDPKAAILQSFITYKNQGKDSVLVPSALVPCSDVPHAHSEITEFDNIESSLRLSADEMLITFADQLTAEQKKWLKSFINQWDAAQGEQNDALLGYLTHDYEAWLDNYYDGDGYGHHFPSDRS